MVHSGLKLRNWPCLRLGKTVSRQSLVSGTYCTNLSQFSGVRHEYSLGVSLNLFRRGHVAATAVSTSIEPERTLRKDDPGVLVMDVTKMMCGGCSASVKKILLQHPNVQDASVNLITGTAVAGLTPGSNDSDIKNIIETVSSKGFPSFERTPENSAEQMEKIRLEKLEEEQNEYVVSCYCHAMRPWHSLKIECFFLIFLCL